MNQLINDETVYRTAPATPGLLNISTSLIQWSTVNISRGSFKKLVKLTKTPNFEGATQ